MEIVKTLINAVNNYDTETLIKIVHPDYIQPVPTENLANENAMFGFR